MQQFQELPLEIQEKILSYIPLDLPIISQLSSEMYKIVNRSYVNVLGRLPISVSEYTKYTRQFPLILGSHIRLQEDTNKQIYYITEMYTRRLSDTYNRIRIITTLDDNVDFRYDHDMVNQLYVTSFVKDTDYDLMTMKRILQNRRGCVQRDPQYVKNYLRRYIQRRFSIVTSDNLVDFYLYLWMNANVLNLEYIPINLFWPRVQNVESKLISEIKILSTLVYEWIQKL